MKDGGFAFPRPLPPGMIATPEVLAKYGGMSIRDWFAGQALAGGLWIGPRDEPRLAEIIAKHAYTIADAMIAAGEE